MECCLIMRRPEVWQSVCRCLFLCGNQRTLPKPFTPEAAEQNRALLELLQSIAELKNATLAQISLAWMLCKKPWIVPIPGSRKPERIKENAGAADIRLSTSEVAALDHMLDTVPMSAVFGGFRVLGK